MKYFIEQTIKTEFETDSTDKFDIDELTYTAIGEKYEPYVFNASDGSIKDINEIITVTDEKGNRIRLHTSKEVKADGTTTDGIPSKTKVLGILPNEL